MAVVAAANNNGYSMRDIIDRYESEEDEFIRELEDMRKSLTTSEQEDEVPQDPAPLLSVLCSLVDEIGSLRTENRQLKTRMHTSTTNTTSRPRNVVQRMSAIFDSRSILPKLRRPSTSNEIRNGARERLSTPPRKDPLTASSVSTDFSNGSRDKAPPLVEPERSDSDIDEHVFSEDQSTYERRGRADSRRCDMSMSECTSPSSASSSRDPSETMMSSRSSFFDLFGFRRSTVNMRKQPTALPPQPAKSALKKRKRRVTSQDDVTGYTPEYRARIQQKPPRPASYFPREDSEDSDHNRINRKATSFLSVSGNFNRNDNMMRAADRETRLIHEKDGMAAEIEELKMRNQRLVEQLRDKSFQYSKIQLQYNKLENQFDVMANRCAFNDNLEKLCLDERVQRAIVTTHEEIDDILRSHELHVQAAKAENSGNHQKAINMCTQDRTIHQNCVEQIDKVQSDLFNLMKERLRDSQNLDSHLKRRLELLPSYESLYTFTAGVVRKITDLRWSLIEKSAQAGKTEMELLSTQSLLLVTYAQLERMRILMRDTKRKRRRRRAASYHGENAEQRIVKPELNFYVPFKMHGSRVENMRRIRNKKSLEPIDRSPEEDFLQMFATPRDVFEQQQQQQRALASSGGSNGMQRPSSRIADMMREMSTGRTFTSREQPVQQSLKFSPVLERLSDNRSESRRPISLVEIENDRFKRSEETRRSMKQLRKQASVDKPSRSVVVVPSVDISRIIQPPKSQSRPQTRIYEMVPEMPPPLPTMPPGTPLRSRKLERGYSTESRVEEQLSEIQRKRDELAKELEEKRLSFYRDERDARLSMLEERRPVRLQRSQPVKMSRIKPPTQSSLQASVQMKSRTLEAPSLSQLPQMRCPPPTQTMPSSSNDQQRPKLERSKTIDTHDVNVQMRTSGSSKLPKPNRKSWFDKFKSIKK